MKFTPDYIIVGAGSSGCVLANRLSADPTVKVLLLEAGGRDASLFYRMPAGFFELMRRGTGNWNFETVPQVGLNGRSVYFPRGKVLGGSSSINGLVVSRGNAGDYDRWAQLGNAGWSWEECLPFFKRIEDCRDADSDFRGTEGPIAVSWTEIDGMNPTSRALIDGGIQAGHRFNADVNCGNPIGVAQMQGNYRNGVRQSASARYLGPIVGRPNLQVLTGAVAQRIIFRGGRATGLQYSHRGRIRTQEAGLEILLASGVVNSPQLLQLSGVGDPKDIMPHKIAVTHELPGVGKNLRDHLSVTVKQRLTRPYSLLQELRPLAKVKALSQYLLFKSGPTAVGGLEAWAHLNSRPDIEYPDIQLYTIPLMYNDHGRDVIDEEGFQLVLNGCRPNSSGSIRIASGDPGTAPLIDPQYLSDPEDLRVLREGIRLARDIIAQPAYSDFRGAEYSPGGVAASDAALDSYIRSTAQTIYHPVGTCKMGSDDLAVVDPSLRVRGIAGLRVVDASVMPDIVSGNTNFPAMMIAEKAAQMIISDSASA